jgi:flavin reductase (DIM6/NTAB) family NADH-FMN oxidoreductase RutF
LNCYFQNITPFVLIDTPINHFLYSFSNIYGVYLLTNKAICNGFRVFLRNHSFMGFYLSDELWYNLAYRNIRRYHVTNPAMVSIAVRKERYSYPMIIGTGEFVINLTTQVLTHAADFCGVKSGRDLNKFKETGLTPLPAVHVKTPLIAESPVNIECKVHSVTPLGSHDLILANVLGVNVDEALLSASGKLELSRAGLVAYSHGAYYTLGNALGTFGFSVKKPAKKKRRSSQRPK